MVLVLALMVMEILEEIAMNSRNRDYKKALPIRF